MQQQFTSQNPQTTACRQPHQFQEIVELCKHMLKEQMKHRVEQNPYYAEAMKPSVKAIIDAEDNPYSLACMSVLTMRCF